MAATIIGTPPTVQSWKVVGALPTAMSDFGLVALGSRLYALGGAGSGDGGFALTASTWMTSLGGNELLTPWMPAGDLPKPLWAFSVVTDGSRVFVIGGDDSESDATNSVYVGTPNASQQLEWKSSTPMKVVRRHLCAVLANITWNDTTPLPVAQSAMGCMAR